MSDLDLFMKNNNKNVRDVRHLTVNRKDFLVKLKKVYEEFETNNFQEIRDGIDICIEESLRAKFDKDESSIKIVLNEIKSKLDYKAELLFDREKLDLAILPFIKSFQKSQPSAVYDELEEKLASWFINYNNFTVKKFILYLKSNKISRSDVEALKDGSKEEFLENHFVSHFSDSMRVDEEFNEILINYAEIYVEEKYSNDSDFINSVLEEVEKDVELSGEVLFDNEKFEEKLEQFIDDFAELYLHMMIQISLSERYEDESLVKSTQAALNHFQQFRELFEMHNVVSQDELDKVLLPIIELFEKLQKSLGNLLDLLHEWYPLIDDKFLNLLSSFLKENIHDLSVFNNLTSSKFHFVSTFNQKFMKSFAITGNVSKEISRILRILSIKVLDLKEINVESQSEILNEIDFDEINREFIFDTEKFNDFLFPKVEGFEREKLKKAQRKAFKDVEEKITKWFKHLQESTIEDFKSFLRSRNISLIEIDQLMLSKEKFSTFQVVQDFCDGIENEQELQGEIEMHVKLIVENNNEAFSLGEILEEMKSSKFEFKRILLFDEQKLIENIKFATNSIEMRKSYEELERNIGKWVQGDSFLEQNFVDFVKKNSLTHQKIAQLSLRRENLIKSEIFQRFYSANERILIDEIYLKLDRRMSSENIFYQNKALTKKVIETFKSSELDRDYAVKFLFDHEPLDELFEFEKNILLSYCMENIWPRSQKITESFQVKCVAKEFCKKNVVFDEKKFQTNFQPFLDDINRFFDTVKVQDEKSKVDLFKNSLTKLEKLENFEIDCIANFAVQQNMLSNFFTESDLNDEKFDEEIDLLVENYSNFFNSPEKFVNLTNDARKLSRSLLSLWIVFSAYFLFIFVVNAFDAIKFNLEKF